MFRPMRRMKQELSHDDCVEILERGTYGVLAVVGDEGWPYAVPVSYDFANDTIYLHGAKEGHKLDAIAAESRVSFCVVDKNELVPERFTTHFRSVICFGHARIIGDDAEKLAALELIAAKFGPEDGSGADDEIGSTIGRVAMVKIPIDHMSGKESIELVRMRRG